MLFVWTTQGFAQIKSAESIGLKHIKTLYQGDTVDVLIKSKKGEEFKKKPLFLFFQGSLPIPLIIYDGENSYPVFPFQTDSLEIDYHIAIIGKPSIPLITDSKTLGTNFMYQDPQTGKTSTEYSKRNLLDYYVDRNLQVIKTLQELPFIDNSKLVVAGHSEGSRVACKLASKSKKVTHLIYASGCPLGRIMTMIQKSRGIETDSTQIAENNMEYWEEIVKNKNDMDDSRGDTYKAMYDFSNPYIEYFKQLKIPILVCYGTKDHSAPYNDYLRVEMIRQQKKNFTFKSYIGLEHNFSRLTADGKPDYDKSNWDKIANEWWKWTKQKK